MTTTTVPSNLLFTTHRGGHDEMDIRQLLAGYQEIHRIPQRDQAMLEAKACIKCGLPLCRSANVGGCPLSNPIPIAHALIASGDRRGAWNTWRRANPLMEMMIACPAPCQSKCVAGIGFEPIAIRSSEMGLAEESRANGWEGPPQPAKEQPYRIAFLGSGPSTLAAAQFAREAGLHCEVFERSDLLGGLLTEGIPNFHLDKSRVHYRLDLLSRGGVVFHTGIDVGQERHPIQLKGDKILIYAGPTRDDPPLEFDYLFIGIGAKIPRQLPLDFEGRSLGGVYQAMDFLVPTIRKQLGAPVSRVIDTIGHDVAVIGGGLTGIDCRSTTLRQGSDTTTTFIRKPLPMQTGRTAWTEQPNPLLDILEFREGGTTEFGTNPVAFIDQDGFGQVTHMVVRDLRGLVTQIPATRVFLALGFLGPGMDSNGLPAQLGLRCNANGRVIVDGRTFRSERQNVYVVGDANDQGEDLIVNAVQQGRDAMLDLLGTLGLAPLM